MSDSFLTREELEALDFHQWCGLGISGPGNRRKSYQCDCTEKQRTLIQSAIRKLFYLMKTSYNG